MLQRNRNETTLLAGWLFADLLLGMMVIFLAAIQGAPLPQQKPPIMVVQPASLTVPDNDACTIGNIDKPRCNGAVTLSEPKDSHGDITWKVGSDMSENIVYKPNGGVLHPGETVQVAITAVPCQKGSFTFSGTFPGTFSSQQDVQPVSVAWVCTPKPDRLETDVTTMTFDGVNADGIRSGDGGAIANFKQQIMGRFELRGRRVGIAIVSVGAPTEGENSNAVNDANAIYNLLDNLGAGGFTPFQNAAHYGALHVLGFPSSHVVIDVYLFKL